MASAYLLSRRRGLRETCLEVMEGCGIEPPCASCGLDDLCERCLGDPLKTDLTGELSHPIDVGTPFRRHVRPQQIH